jgi:hypothetical protein
MSPVPMIAHLCIVASLFAPGFVAPGWQPVVKTEHT